MRHRWTPETIVTAIQAEAAAGHDLSYVQTLQRSRLLLRAAERYFGKWSAAVEAAAIDYSAYRKTRVWSREQILERLRYWHGLGEDVSFTAVANRLDPALAAAVFHAHRFASWAEALTAAGLDPEAICHGMRWTPARIERECRALMARGVSLKQTSLAREAPKLLMAIYRHAGSLLAVRYTLGLETPRKTRRRKARRFKTIEELCRAHRPHRFTPEESPAPASGGIVPMTAAP
jgi:hypothetical protein